MTINAIAIAIAAVVGCAGTVGGYEAGRATAVAAATCQVTAQSDGGYTPTYQPLPMTSSRGF